MVGILDDPIAYLGHDEAAMRRLGISVCVATGLDDDAMEMIRRIAVRDEDGGVRAAAVEAVGGADVDCSDVLLTARDDEDVRVVEAVATAYGELHSQPAVPWLVDVATTEGDRAAREAAVAALGAIGDVEAIPTLLTLVAAAPPQIRRRAVVALTVFDDPAVETAIRAAAKDRNPSVREAAEMVVGREADCSP